MKGSLKTGESRETDTDELGTSVCTAFHITIGSEDFFGRSAIYIVERALVGRSLMEHIGRNDAVVKGLAIFGENHISERVLDGAGAESNVILGKGLTFLQHLHQEEQVSGSHFRSEDDRVPGGKFLKNFSDTFKMRFGLGMIRSTQVLGNAGQHRATWEVDRGVDSSSSTPWMESFIGAPLCPYYATAV